MKSDQAQPAFRSALGTSLASGTKSRIPSVVLAAFSKHPRFSLVHSPFLSPLATCSNHISNLNPLSFSLFPSAFSLSTGVSTVNVGFSAIYCRLIPILGRRRSRRAVVISPATRATIPAPIRPDFTPRVAVGNVGSRSHKKSVMMRPPRYRPCSGERACSTGASQHPWQAPASRAKSRNPSIVLEAFSKHPRFSLVHSPFLSPLATCSNHISNLNPLSFGLFPSPFSLSTRVSTVNVGFSAIYCRLIPKMGQHLRRPRRRHLPPPRRGLPRDSIDAQPTPR